MRGEHWESAPANIRCWGSSPHARGTPDGRSQGDLELGIIPACAGNTLRYSSIACIVRDHPRMRGEHQLVVIPVVCGLGSSPHARGTRSVCFRVYSAFWDHPRMRGEHNASRIASHPYRGSSPHARGTHDGHRCVLGDVGIIPACAGNTLGRR